jgi:hypothetical protein
MSAVDLNKNIMVITTKIMILLNVKNIANYSSYIYTRVLLSNPQMITNPGFGSGKKVSMMTMLLPVLAAILSLMLITPSSGYVNASSSSGNNNTNTTTSTTLSPNQLAAGGPLPGNLSQVEKERECITAEQNETTNLPWYPTIANTEHSGSERSGVFACATFGGSYTEPNQVYAYQSPSLGAVPSWVLTREPNELYVIGGGASLAVPGQFVSKLEAGSLKEDWRTPLSNNNVTGDWLISGAANFPLADGTIAVSQGSYLWKVNASTGAVEKMVSLPTGENPPGDSNFDGMNAFADGTLVLKTQNRVAGCTYQGYAFFQCPNQSQVAPSVVVAVDPITFEVLDWEQLSEMAPPRNTVSHFQGKDYVYLTGSMNMSRYEWNGQNLTLDTSWGPVPYLTEGQTAGSAAAVMGDWVVLLTNAALPTNSSMSVVAISQADPNKIARINPIPLEPGQQSNVPSMVTVDLPNNRIYAFDFYPGKIVALDFDPQTGNMSVAWGPVAQRTLSFLTLIGPSDQRVLVASNINPNATQQQLEDAATIKGFTYTEQIVWRDAATGNVLAQSDYFPAMSPGILVTPGYGGLIYELLYNGHIMALQVAPAIGAPSPSANNGGQ